MTDSLTLSQALLLGAAFCAGFVDAVVGGGGLIQVPALFTSLPAASPATLFGTNKFASIFGTANACWRYTRRVALPWRSVLPAMGAALLCAYLGAATVAWLPVALLRPLVLILLIGVAWHTFHRPQLGLEHQVRHTGGAEIGYSLLLGAACGFYDGLFGPGTGSFLIFLYVRGFGFDFLHASASAKLINVTTNAAALAYFLPHGYVLLPVALGMAACNLLGASLGTATALRYGSRFVRQAFLALAISLILRFAWETLTVFGG